MPRNVFTRRARAAGPFLQAKDPPLSCACHESDLLLHSRRSMSDVAPPRLTFTMELRVEVAAPVEVGAIAAGRRRIVAIRGGTFEGPELRGRVREGGADWQIVRHDGVAELDTRYTLETDRGELIYIQNAGLRHAEP